MSSYHRIQTEKWLKTIDVKADRVLDVGGSQLPIKGRTKSWDVKEYKILDLPEPHECKQEPDIITDINDSWIEDSRKEVDEELKDEGLEISKYDIIFCIEVNEYWWNSYQALKNINYLLKIGGILYITFPFIYMAHKPEGMDFLRYTPAGVEKLLKETNFEIIEHKFRMATSGKLVEFYNEEKMRGLSDFNHNIIGSMIKAKKYYENFTNTG